MADGGVERECRQGGIEVREMRVVGVPPYEGVIRMNRQGVDLVEGSKVLKMRFYGVRGKHVSNKDIQTSGIFEEITFTHERQEAEFESAMDP